MKDRMTFIKSCLIILFLIQSMLGDSMKELKELLPSKVKGWRISAEDQYYNRKNLYDYINGGAELYLSYGFLKMATRSLERQDQPQIIIDVFDMGTSDNAFGIFSHARESIEKQFGQGSQYTAGLLMFWKDKYFISILASPETVEAKDAVYQIAEEIDQKIVNEGKLPGILDYLPAESLQEESVKYVKHHLWINSHYYISGENIFNINEKTNVVLAKYSDNNEFAVLLLVKYPSKNNASLALQSFRKVYLPEYKQNNVIKLEDDKWIGSQQLDNFIVVVFNATSEQSVNRLIQSVIIKMNQ